MKMMIYERRIRNVGITVLMIVHSAVCCLTCVRKWEQECLRAPDSVFHCTFYILVLSCGWCFIILIIVACIHNSILL